ncbi:acetyl-CoA synthetase-like protein [Heliocybe sulcata]|uniref:Acetyl-CoA synthetase-like protein n=1 Tax=Heliocybe sulcata TaxID=5364 RepID=A0A5C3NIF6_9AGAM|nr:acetyl-CoA synthetase-like protein [Heliocybe sulcata]
MSTLPKQLPIESAGSLEDNAQVASGIDAPRLPADIAAQIVNEVYVEPGEAVAYISAVTPMQADMLSVTALHAHAYVGSVAWSINAVIEAEAAQTAWKTVVAGNAILRSQFIANAHGIYRVELDSLHPSRTSLQHLSWDDADLEIIERKQEEYFKNEVKAINILAKGTKQTVVTAGLAPLPTHNGSRFIVTMHHALFDAASVQMLIEDFISALSSIAISRPSFSRYEAHISSMQDREEKKKFWTEYLANAPFEKTSDAAASGRRMRHLPPFPVGNVIDCQKAARALGITAPTLIRMVWALTLVLTTFDHGHIFGEVYSGRDIPLADVDHIMGPTISTVPVRSDIKPTQTLKELADTLQESYFDILPYVQVSLGELSQWLDVKQAKLFQSFITLNFAPKNARVGDYDTEFLIATAPVEFELSAEFNNESGVLYCLMSHDSNVVPHELALTAQRHLSGVLQRLISAAEENIAEQTTVQDFVKAQIAQEVLRVLPFEEGEARPVPYTSVVEGFLAQVERDPLAVAVEEGSRVLTYGELQTQSAAVAHQLVALGVGKGSLIPVLVHRELEMVVGIMAVLRAGAAYLPIDEDTPSARIRTLIRDCRADVMVVTSQQALHEPPETFKDDLKHVFIVTEHDGCGAGDGLPVIEASDPAFAIGTSGTTGTPKVSVCRHQPLVNALHDPAGSWLSSPGDRVGNFMGLAFDCCVGEIFSTLMFGATLVLRDDNVDWAVTIDTLDYLQITPTGLQRVKPRPFPKLKRITVAGEPVPTALLKAWLDVVPTFINIYGPSECTVHTTSIALQRNQEITVGRPIANTICRVLDENMQRVPIGMKGELWVGGPGVGIGYLNKPELTAKKYIADPYNEGGRLYTSGDMCRWTEDGRLYYICRKDLHDDIKVKGRRLNLDEISYVISQHPDVKFTAVFVKDDRIVAFLAPETVNIEEVRDSCADVLPHYMVPDVFKAVAQSDLPMTRNGKVDRKELEKLLVEAAPSHLSAPSSILSKLIAKVWAEVLGIDVSGIGMDTSFFQLPNGDSVTAVRVSAALTAAGCKVSPSQVFKLQTIRKLESFLGGPAVAMPVVPAVSKPKARSPPSVSYSTVASVMAELRAADIAEDAIQDIFPANQLQTGLIVALMQDRSKYTTACMWRIRSDRPVDISRVCLSWKRLLNHHSSLRTRFVTTRDGVFQVVIDDAEQRTPLVLGQKNEAECRQFIDQDLKLGFQLGQPMSRLAIIKGPNGAASYIILTMHHSIYDGWSAGILKSDLRAFCYTIPASPAPAYRVFTDYIQSMSKVDAEAYWTKYLEGAMPSDSLSLPASATSGEGNTIHRLIRISPESMRAACVRFGITQATLVNAAWALVLKLYLNRDDVIFGNVQAGRSIPVPDVDKMVGLLLATVPVRVRFVRGMTIRDLLVSLQSAYMGGLDHCHAGLVNIRKWARQDGQASLFHTLVTFGTAEAKDHSKADGFILEDQCWVGDVTEYGADLTFTPHEDGLQLEFIHDPNVLDETATKDIVDELEHLLSVMVEPSSDGMVVDDVPLSVDQMRQFKEFGYGGTAATPFQTMHRGFVAAASKYPDYVALEHYGRKITYRELDNWTNRLACQLQKTLGKIPGKFVGLLVDRSIEFVVGMLAVLKAGAAFVPLDISFPEERLRYMISAAYITHILTTEAIHGAHGHLLGNVSYAFIGSTPSRESHLPKDVAHGEDLSYIIFSSGTTGKPKPIACHHSGAVNNIWFHPAMKHLHPGAHIGQMLAMSFDGTLQEVFGGLFSGATVVIREDDAFSTIKKLDVLSLTPSGMQQLDPQDYPNLKCVFTCGEALPRSLVDKWGTKVALYSDYGPTECCISTSCNLNPYSGDMPITLGRPFPNMSMYVLNGDTRRPVPMGVVGELFIGGVGVAAGGYYGRSDLTIAKFVQDPFMSSGNPRETMYRAGDLVRWLPHGELQFCGRDDTQVKLKGYRIELEEVSSVMRAVAGVDDAFAMIRGTAHGDILVGFVSSKTVDVEAVRRACMASLPSYEIPSEIICLPEFPTTSIGKIDRERLRRIEAPQSTESPVSATELAVQRAIAATLGISIDEVGRHTSFLALGGDSISAIKLMSKARNEGINVSVSQIFKSPSVAALAESVDETQARPLTRLHSQDQVVGDIPLAPAQARFLANAKQLHHYNQSQLCRLKRRIEFNDLQHAVRRLVGHHDLLRAQFQRSGDEWSQVIRPDTPEVGTVSLQHLHVQGNLHDEVLKLSKSLNILEGPLLLVALIEDNERQYVFVAVHHLIVDIISFNILMEDVERVLLNMELEPKTTSFAAWTKHLLSLVETYKPHAWSTALSNDADADAFAKLQGASTGRRKTVKSVLSRQVCENVNAVNMAYGCNTQDIVLTALTLAFHELTGLGPFGICVESHGRSVFAEDMDISRTVGWFTSTFPVTFDLRSTPSTGDALETVRDQLRSVPDKGVSFELLRYCTSRADASTIKRHSLPHIEFNYFGQAANLRSELFEHIDLSLDVDLDADNIDFGIICSVYLEEEGGMVIEFYFDPGSYDEVLLSRFGQAWRTRMEVILTSSSLPPSLPIAVTGAVSKETFEEISVELSAGGLASSDIEDLWKATAAQSAFFLSLMNTPDQYVSQTIYEFSGEISEQDLIRAWKALVNVNVNFRSIFVNTSEGLYQVVLRPTAGSSDATVVLQWLEDQVEESQARFLQEDLSLGFSTSSPCFARMAIARIGSTDRWRCIWTQHHSVSDGWSHALEFEDFLAACGGRRLTPRKPSFKDYAMRLNAIDLSAARGYWRQDVFRSHKCSSFPFPEPLLSDYQGGLAPVSVSNTASGVIRPLHRLCSSIGTTLSTLLRAVWALTMHHYTKEQTVIFGAVVSGRDAVIDDADQVLGTLVNTIPVAAPIDPNVPLSSLLQYLHEQHVESLPHTHATLRDIMQWNGISDLASFFTTTLTFQNFPSAESDEGATFDVQVIQAVENTEFDVNVNLMCVEDAVDVLMTFNSRKFDLPHARGVAEKFVNLLEIISESSFSLATRLKDLDRVSSFDLERLRVMEVGEPMELTYECVHHGFEAHARRQPRAVAVEHGDETISYGELNRLADAVAHRLQQEGVKRGDMIPLITTRSIDMAIAIMAILKAGAAYVPIDKDFPVARIESILASVTSPVTLCHPSTEQAVPGSALPSRAVSISRTSASLLPQVKPGKVSVGRDDPAYVIFTSGTTGKPKGVICVHRSLVNVVMQSPRAFGTAPGSRGASILSVSFDMGTWEVQSCLFNGATVVMRKGPTLDVLQTVDTVFITPTVLSQLSREDLPHVKSIAVSGEPCPEQLIKAWAPHVRFYNSCAPSETTIISFLDQMHVGRRITMGKPLPNVRCYILDPETMQRVPFGCKGEVFISGICVGRGYLNMPQLTAEKFLPDPFAPGLTMFRSGDVGRWTDFGGVEHFGRMDDQVKVKGFRIELLEVANALRRHKDVQQAVALVKNGNLIAFVAPETVDVFDAQDTAARYVPEYMVPSKLTAVPAFPMNRNGKVDKEALLNLGKVPQETKKAVHSLDDIQAMYAEIWASVLKVDVSAIKGDTTFKELGGDSISALRVVAAAKKRGFTIKPSQVADRKTSLSVIATLSASSAVEAQGKVHKDALSNLGETSQETKEAVHSLDDIQAMYAEIWASVLKVDVSAIMGNTTFKELGGDSISALRVVAAAKKRGFTVKPSQVADRKTSLSQIAALSAGSIAKPQPSVVPKLKPASMQISQGTPLTPVMKWYFSLNWRDVGWWNQSFCVAPLQRITYNSFAQALREIVRHHDILRATYRKEGRSWVQTIVPEADHSVAVKHITVSSFDELDSYVRKLQGEIDIYRGPLYQAVLFETASEQRIWIAVHHICIDLVSWRILMEDLEQLLRGEKLGQRTTSFHEWSTLLQQYVSALNPLPFVEYSKSLLVDNDAFVRRLTRPGAPSLAVVERGREIAVGMASITVGKGIEDLLNRGNQFYNTSDQDLLLAALLMSIRTRFGGIAVPLAIVSHGRVPFADDLDVSRSIGWFSTSNGSPHTFDLSGKPTDVASLVEYVQTSLSSFAQEGLDYQAVRWLTDAGERDPDLRSADADVCFNYFGRWQVFAKDAFFKEDGDSIKNPANYADVEILHKPLSITGQVTPEGTLQMDAEFYSELYDEEVIRGVMEGCKQSLKVIFEVAGLSPSADLWIPSSPAQHIVEVSAPQVIVQPDMSMPGGLLEPPTDLPRVPIPVPDIAVSLPTPILKETVTPALSVFDYLERPPLTHAASSSTIVFEAKSDTDHSDHQEGGKFGHHVQIDDHENTTKTEMLNERQTQRRRGPSSERTAVSPERDPATLERIVADVLALVNTVLEGSRQTGDFSKDTAPSSSLQIPEHLPHHGAAVQQSRTSFLTRLTMNGNSDALILITLGSLVMGLTAILAAVVLMNAGLLASVVILVARA